MQTARSASRTCNESSSMVEYTATASMSSSCSARITRTATSPRLAIRTRLNGIERPPQHRLDLEQKLAELDWVAVGDVNPPDDSVELSLDLVHQLHRFEDAERLAAGDRSAFLHKRRRAGRGRPIESAYHRRLDPHKPVARRLAGRWERLELELRRRRSRGRGIGRRGRFGLLAAPDRDPHSRLLDRDLGDAALLDDSHELADALGAPLVDRAADKSLVAPRPASDGMEQRLGLFPEERQQQQLLVARCQSARFVADLVEIGGRLRLAPVVGDELDRAA